MSNIIQALRRDDLAKIYGAPVFSLYDEQKKETIYLTPTGPNDSPSDASFADFTNREKQIITNSRKATT